MVKDVLGKDTTLGDLNTNVLIPTFAMDEVKRVQDMIEFGTSSP